MWEKRYGAVEPERTDTNRRLYSDKSIQRLVFLAELTKNGHSIGHIANLPDERLCALYQSVQEETQKPVEQNKPENGFESTVANVLTAIKNFDQITMDKEFDRVVKDSGYSCLLEKVLLPLIYNVGQLWHDGEFTTAQEHAATSFIKDYLCVSARPYGDTSNSPKLLITTPSGQLHELGAVIAATQARKLGWHVIYLGTSLPAEEIAGAAEKINARAVVLSIIYPLDDPQINANLRRLRSQLDHNIPIIVGGARSKFYAPTLEELEIIQLSKFADLKPALDNLRK